MTKPVSISNTFAGQTGNLPLSELDQNFATLQTALNDPATYQNYGADSGTVNAMVVTLNPVPSSLASMIGVPIQVKVNVTNTGAVTLNLNSFGAISVVDLLNTALTAGLLVAGQTVQMIYNGSVFQWQGQVPVAVGASGRLLNTQYFTASGTYTPTSGTNSVIVEVVGGGGGGGGTAATAQTVGGGGGGGGYARKKITSSFSGVTVTIGSAGTAGASGANAGGAGGTSSFGALVSATGGSGGGSGSTSFRNTSGGSGSSGDLNLTGGNGISISTGTTTNSGISIGGTCPVYGAAVANGGTSSGNAAFNYGNGGSGASSGTATSAAGAAGTAGIVIVYEYA